MLERVIQPETTIKDEARRLVERLPEDATWEDLQYEIYLRQAVEATVRTKELPVEAFAFSDRIWEVFPRADAVLMRAGALSVAEAALFGKPCVLVPYPFAADRHQERNAEEFCAGGGGVWIRQEDATGGKVLDVFSSWANDPSRLAAASAWEMLIVPYGWMIVKFAAAGRRVLAILGENSGATLVETITKIRNAELAKIPFAVVIGEKEVEAKGVSPRRHGGEDLKTMGLDAFIDLMKREATPPY